MAIFNSFLYVYQAGYIKGGKPPHLMMKPRDSSLIRGLCEDPRVCEKSVPHQGKYIILYYTMLCHILLYYIMLYYMILYIIMSYFIILYYIMLCHIL